MTPPETGPAAGADPTASPAAEAEARAKVIGWARRSADRIPTSWLIPGAGAVVLAATALFGGLEAAAVDPPPVVEVGEAFSGSDLTMTVLGAELRDVRGNAAAYIDEAKGERLLVLTVDVVNTFEGPRASTMFEQDSPVVDGIRIRGIDEKAAVSRADDGHSDPRLQADVPARLLLAWVVGPDDFRDGEEITVTLPDSDHVVGRRVIRGDYWQNVRVGATLPVTIVDRAAAA